MVSVEPDRTAHIGDEQLSRVGYSFQLLDKKNADTVFGQGKYVLGIEVTDPTLATRCNNNIDPQHSGQDPNTAAIELIRQTPLPPDGAILTTIRADYDSVGAMALIDLIADYGKADNPQIENVWNRVDSIAKADRHGRGPWPGRRKLPRPGDKPDQETYSGVPSGLGVLVYDKNRQLPEKVALMKQWLLTGKCPGLEAAQVQAQKDCDKVIESCKIYAVYPDDTDIRVHPITPDDDPSSYSQPSIAFIESNNSRGLRMGYNVAPVVVGINPEQSFPGDVKGLKQSVAQYSSGFADIKAITADLAQREPGWGGSPMFAGSPTDRPSILEPSTVVQTTLKHLKS